MQLIHDMNDFPATGSVVALGTFDGVHRGHASLLRECVQLARARSVPAVALTFDRHPLALICPEKAPVALISAEEKRELMAAQGLDVLVEQPFTRAFADLTPEEFFHRVQTALRPRALVVGFNYSFGCRGKGDVALLRMMCEQQSILCRVMEPVTEGGAPISSSRIRALMKAGEREQAERLLGWRRRGG